MKVWELHGMRLDGAIRTTPDGEADIEGLVLSEKAYLVAVRDYRPAQLVELVRRQGPEGAADSLVGHFVVQGQYGTNPLLIRTRSRIGGPGIARTDEVHAPDLVPRR